MDNLAELEVVQKFPADGELYCPECGDYRRMRVDKLYEFDIKPTPKPARPITHNSIPIEKRKHLGTCLFLYVCLQCQTTFTALVYKSTDDQFALAVFPTTSGGLTTPHTPDGVAYYLDQASKAQSSGATSAAIAMYRGALEHLLYDQGYNNGMLGAKLNNLEQDIKDNKAPKWAIELETDFLTVIKDLGNGSIHPNDGDITKQKALDNELIELVKLTFYRLLNAVYELPLQKASNLAELKRKADMLKK